MKIEFADMNISCVKYAARFLSNPCPYTRIVGFRAIASTIESFDFSGVGWQCAKVIQISRKIAHENRICQYDSDEFEVFPALRMNGAGCDKHTFRISSFRGTISHFICHVPVTVSSR
jgi:hypothetical protein